MTKSITLSLYKELIVSEVFSGIFSVRCLDMAPVMIYKSINFTDIPVVFFLCIGFAIMIMVWVQR